MTLYPIASILRVRHPAALLMLLTGLAGCSLWPASAPDSSRSLPGEEAEGGMVDPKLARPEVKVRQIRPEDIEVGAYLGGFAITRDKIVGVYGLRGAYHISENFWTEARYVSTAESEFKDAAKALGLNQPPPFSYDSLDLGVGYDLLPGDLYISNRYTLPIAFYAVGALGYAHYSEYPSDNRFLAYDVGGGLKLLPRDWLTIRFELRDQFWARDNTEQNLEFSFGLAAFF